MVVATSTSYCPICSSVGHSWEYYIYSIPTRYDTQ
uniref:Uncharacterized protein n=1 Tax=Bacteriophage sp. TaxID=38018 RepID=A0A8D9UIR5_9VIRU|nr:MAG TPA: hypothetical protein [Bacteriophage sp.]DAK77993.1 MAG TPA: C2H2 type zinc-finger protein [Caudoviricetes sp.]DAE76901.1 MAG TPA: hypothetical protein [Bacteriophage sp.]DAJ65894.1 MAG TPA: C2H2 type zinc-finger protein [Bacteriophage sp.]DAM13207.1 MAG TPA: C2H2 type zinc-finger protein [Bacteriophage sp.]